MKVVLTEVSLGELEGIYEYIARDNHAAALTVIVRIKEIINRLSEFPYLGRPANESQVRVLPAMPFSYLIFYAVGRREVIIRNIRHAGRNRL